MNIHVNTKAFKREFGMTIRRKRHKLNLSQENFADMADIHRTYVSSIELGKVDVGIGVAYKIAKALSLSLSKLIKEAEACLKD
jgi:transcriptional regulator with XRE-family HTH domain